MYIKTQQYKTKYKKPKGPVTSRGTTLVELLLYIGLLAILLLGFIQYIFSLSLYIEKDLKNEDVKRAGNIIAEYIRWNVHNSEHVSISEKYIQGKYKITENDITSIFKFDGYKKPENFSFKKEPCRDRIFKNNPLNLDSAEHLEVAKCTGVYFSVFDTSAGTSTKVLNRVEVSFLE